MAEQSPYEKEITLPSQGLLYGGALPEGRLTIKGMTIKEERLLVGNESGGQVFNKVLSRLVELPATAEGFTISDLTIEDRLFCFINIRSLSMTPHYEFQYQCGDCKDRVNGRVNLDKMELMPPTDLWYQDENGEAKDAPEPFFVKLPNGDEIGWRFLRGNDEEAITKFGRQMARKARQEGDPEYTFRLAKHIVAIGDKSIVDKTLTFKEVREYVETLRSADTAELRNHMEDNRAGIDMMYDDNCPLCGGSNEFILPFEARAFFRIHQRRGELSS